MEYIAMIQSRDRIADGFNFPFCTSLVFYFPQEVSISCAIFLQVSVQGHTNLGTHKMLKNSYIQSKIRRGFYSFGRGMGK